MSNINQYPIEAFQINDEDFYDVDYWNGVDYETRKISGLTLKTILQALPPLAEGFIWQGDAGGNAVAVPLTPDSDTNLYNLDGSLTAGRFVTLNGFQLFFTDADGSTKLAGGNLIEVSSNTGQEALIKLSAGNGQKRGLEFTDQGASRWQIVVDDIESGLNSGSDLKIYRFDDSGVIIGNALEINRESGQLTVNGEYSIPELDGNAGEVLTTDGAGTTSWTPVTAPVLNEKNFASTQWSTTASSVPLNNGVIANGMTFFTNANKVASGITTWDEYDISFGIDLTITGTNGTIVINFGPITGTEFSETMTFSGTIEDTVEQFVINNKALALSAGNANLLYNGGSTMRFCSSEAVCNSVATTLPTGDMASVRINPFTGLNSAAPDHILVPYVNKPYEGKRLQHKFRVNFGIETGNTQTLALSLRRFEDDSIIGSEMKVVRDLDVEGNQFNFLTYTSGANDPFVEGGFYFALRNDSGSNVNINGAVGIYIETTYESPTVFI